MKTEEEIKNKLQWLLGALDDEENKNSTTQCKMWAQIDFIRWLINDTEKFKQWCRE